MLAERTQVSGEAVRVGCMSSRSPLGQLLAPMNLPSLVLVYVHIYRGEAVCLLSTPTSHAKHWECGYFTFFFFPLFFFPIFLLTFPEIYFAFFV